MKIAMLDDYQNVALKMADWSALSGRARSLYLATGYVSESLYRTFYVDSVAHIAAWLDRRDKDKAVGLLS